MKIVYRKLGSSHWHIIERLQTGYPKRGSRSVERDKPFIRCGAGIYVALGHDDVAPLILAESV